MKDPLAQLFEHETDDAVPVDHAAKIRAGLGALLTATAPPPSPTSTQAPTTPNAPPAPPSTAATGAQAAAGVKLTTALVVGLGMAAGGFAIGRSTAPAAPAPVVTAAPPIVTTSAPVAPPVVVPATSVPSIAVDVLPATEPPPARPTAPTKPASSATTSAFDREQSLLERARSALVRHDAAAAQEALDTCDREFPKSRLAEERDYLRIQLARERGDTAQARDRARAFLSKYPDSLLRTRVEPLAQ